MRPANTTPSRLAVTIMVSYVSPDNVPPSPTSPHPLGSECSGAEASLAQADERMTMIQPLALNPAQPGLQLPAPRSTKDDLLLCAPAAP